MSTVSVQCADCLDFLGAMESESVDAVITDPPYGTKKVAWDETIDARIISECLRVSRGYSIFCYSNTRLWHILGIIRGLGFDSWVMVWHKSNSVGFERKFAPQWTPIVCVYRKGVKFWGQDYCHVPIVPQKVDHPTPKPVKLMEWLIERATVRGNTVLDPFMGSGTTGVAAVRTGRDFVGCDIDPVYCESARARILAEIEASQAA